jgi:molybdate transport system regulatory protein
MEQEGRLVMSEYRLRLLEYVQETGSLAQAASRMRLSYRRAWGKIKELEQNLGIALVHSESGGAGGGHTTLTPEAIDLLARYRDFQQRMDRALTREYETAFSTSRDATYPPAPLP